MHSYKQSKKEIAIRFFSYGVLTVAVLVLSAIGILTVLGYQFDPNSNSLEQTALIQFRSAPSGASVKVDGKQLSGNTATRTNVQTGSHTALVSLSGYRDWQTTFNVEGGTVLWLNYSLLIPTNLQTKSVATTDTTVTSDQTSPDKKWRLMTLTSDSAALALANFNDPQNPVLTTSTVPSDVLTKADDGTLGSITVVSWDSGSRYALLRHTYGATTEYLRYDRQNPAQVRNLSKELGVDSVAKIGFGDSSGNVYYALSGTDIRKLDLGSGTISQPLVTNVTQMYYTDGSDTIAFARVENGVTSMGVYRDPGGLVITNTYAVTPQNLLVTYGGEYYGYRYMATYHDGNVYLVQSPDTRQPKVLKTIALPAVQWLYFSPSGRMLVAQNGNGFMTYDIETDHVYNQTLGVSDATTTKFSWLDDFHLATNAGNSIVMSDFDGTNIQTLGAATAGTGVELSNNAEWLFSLTNANGKTNLQQTALRVK